MRRSLAPFLAALLSLAACNGGGHFHFVSLNLQTIDPPAPAIFTYAPQECYAWVDEENELNIAARFRNIALLGPLQQVSMSLSFVLDAPPAGSGKNYPIAMREMRARFDSASAQHRMFAQSGVLSATRKPDGGYKGSFRIIAQHYAGGLSRLSLMPQRPGQLLIFGTYDATPNAARGREIRTATESAGWSRPPLIRATTQPTVAPSAEPPNPGVEVITPE